MKIEHNSASLSLRQTGHVSCYIAKPEGREQPYVAYSALGTSVYIDLDVCRVLLPFMRELVEAETRGPFVPDSALDEVGAKLAASIKAIDEAA